MYNEILLILWFRFIFYVIFKFKKEAEIEETRPTRIMSEMSDLESESWEGVTVELQGCHDQHTSPASPCIALEFISMFPSQRLRGREQNWHCQPHPRTTGNTGAELQLHWGKYRDEHYREQDEGGGDTAATITFLCRPPAVWREEECSLLQHKGAFIILRNEILGAWAFWLYVQVNP